MNPRLRLVIVIAFVVIIIGVVAAFVLGGGQSSPDVAQGDTSGDTQTDNSNNNNPPPVEAGPSPTPIPVVEIVVSVQDIPRGLTIPPNAVVIRPWPEEFAPVQAITDLEDVVGKRARTDIFREQPILSNMVVEDLTDLASVGSDLAAILPANRVAVALPVDRITSVAYGIQPGDRVDIIISLLFVNVDTAFQSVEPNQTVLFSFAEDGSLVVSEAIPGRVDTIPLGTSGSREAFIVPREEARPRLTTQRTIQDALVMWAGDFPTDGRLFLGAAPTPTPIPVEEGEAPPEERTDPEAAPTAVPSRPDIITLAVSPQDAVTLTWFVEARLPITFALRSATSTSQVETEPVTLDYILNNFNISVPDRFSYSIEPAIRSIRQLYTGEQIQLSGVSTEQE